MTKLAVYDIITLCLYALDLPERRINGQIVKW